MKFFRNSASILLVLIFAWSCQKGKTTPKYKTQNIVVIVVDGPRYSETWGNPDQALIPHMKTDMAPEGVTFTQFRCNGPTYTNAGHTALLSGHYQMINNSGGERPQRPNFLNYWLKKTKADQKQAWLFASKDKIQPLADSQDSLWAGQYLPAVDCGNAGLGSGYRADSITVKHVIDSMETYKPKMVFINLREPDVAGHSGDWDRYIEAVKQVDKDYYAIWNYIRQSPHYKNTTSLFITNDHGRHLDSVGSFASHGDNCEGCRHINLFAYGPDFKKGEIVDAVYEQIDIPSTISEMMDLGMQTSDGKVIKELFKE